MGTDQNIQAVNESLKCKNCGATLTYAPGTHSLVCSHCHTTNEIVDDNADDGTGAYDFNEFVEDINNNKNTFQSAIVKCGSCGATTSLPANVVSDKCPFCGAALVVSTEGATQLVKPHYLLPFVIDSATATKNFKTWLKGLRFAPFGMSKAINENASSLQGVYLPHWIFDSDTETTYTGKRGDYYYTTEYYTETVNGQTQERTREVRHTNWTFVQGTVDCSFTNLTVAATNSLTGKSDEALKPWDLDKLVHFDERYLSGFRSEAYQIKPEDGFQNATGLMVPYIKQAVFKDIGGDEQVIDTSNIEYDNVGIKYVLLPVWISSYNYNNKVYQFIVNANTGWVTGERPISKLKIFIWVMVALIVITIFVLGFMGVRVGK